MENQLQEISQEEFEKRPHHYVEPILIRPCDFNLWLMSNARYQSRGGMKVNFWNVKTTKGNIFVPFLEVQKV